ncbi:MAG: hypothetical protein IKU48_01750 [Clostridia bacterium]|nr:hypothetical protein [Clostridia bacterium]
MYNIGVFCFGGGICDMTRCMHCCKSNNIGSHSHARHTNLGRTAQNNCDSLTAQK